MESPERDIAGERDREEYSEDDEQAVPEADEATPPAPPSGSGGMRIRRGHKKIDPSRKGSTPTSPSETFGPQGCPPSLTLWKALARKRALKAADKVDLTKMRSFKPGQKKAFGKRKGETWHGPVKYKDGHWRETPLHKSENIDLSSLKVITYNVLFMDGAMGKDRVPVIMSILERSDADIICLMEVIPEFVVLLLKEKWVQKAYYVSDGESARSVDPHGPLILSKVPFYDLGQYEVPSRARRPVVIGQFKVNHETLTVCAVHLDSPPRDGPLRIAQLDAVFHHFHSLGAQQALIMGDTNFPNECIEMKHLAEKYPQAKDAWLTLKPNDPGYTFSVTQNDLTVTLFPGEKDKRLDKIFYAGDLLQPTSIEILGTDPIKKGEMTVRYKEKPLYPSDHFAVSAVFNLRKPNASLNVAAPSDSSGKKSPRHGTEDDKCICM